MERRAFEISVNGREIELTYDNHGVAMFRDSPENDYLDITEWVGDEESHTLVFRQRWILLWMGRIATQEGDMEKLAGLERTNGTFSGRTGFNSRVMVEDVPSDFEAEMYIKSMLKDLDKAEGVDDLLAD